MIRPATHTLGGNGRHSACIIQAALTRASIGVSGTDDYTARIGDLKKRQFLSAFLHDHPGIQHKAGVPLGGSFILVYHGEPDMMGAGFTTSADLVLEVAVSPLPATTLAASGTTPALTAYDQSKLSVSANPQLANTLAANPQGAGSQAPNPQAGTVQAAVYNHGTVDVNTAAKGKKDTAKGKTPKEPQGTIKFSFDVVLISST